MALCHFLVRTVERSIQENDKHAEKEREKTDKDDILLVDRDRVAKVTFPLNWIVGHMIH